MSTSHQTQNTFPASTAMVNSSSPSSSTLIERVCRRPRAARFLEQLSHLSAASIQIAAQSGTQLLASASSELFQGSTYQSTVTLRHAHQPIAAITVGSAGANVLPAATLVQLWLEEMLALEDEVFSLTHEVVHSYEELHLLYQLGAALNGVLDVKAAAEIVVAAMLTPLNAARATLTLNTGGTETIFTAAADTALLGADANLAARAVADFQIDTHASGSLVVEGKCDAADFSSGDIKLLDGVGAVVAPTLRAAQLYEIARAKANIDGLTGINNHRRLQERLDEELERARRYNHPLAMLLIDIDNFKLFNDVYGHPVGDRVIQAVAQCLTDNIRANDVIGRYGGDEFMVLLPETDAAGAAEFGERLLRSIADNAVAVDNDTLPIAISLGLASFPADADTKHELVAHADSALYESKRSGGQTLRMANSLRTDWITMQGNTFGVLEGLVQSVDAKDHYTREHSEAVTDAALILAQRLNLSEETCRALRIAGLLHDVGKIGIPDHVLKKPGKLTDDEYSIMKQHVELSEIMIKNVPYLTDVLDAVAHHHERFDGNGYPRGKLGTEIPLIGRIMAIADAYSAMCLDRPYRKGLTWSQTRDELMSGSGKQFDPELVEVFVAAMEDLLSSGQPIARAGQAHDVA